jgi:hypothetical protein
MASSSNVRAGGAFVEIFTDNTPLVRGLRQAQGMLAGWSKGLAKLGGAIAAPLALVGVTGVAGIIALGDQFASYGDQVHKMSARTGMATEAITELSHAAGLSGTDLQTVERGLIPMQKLIANAARGSRTASDALGSLGLSAQQLEGQLPDQQLAIISDRLAGISDPAMRTAAAMRIFGGAGQKLLPMLEGGAAGLEAMRQEARDLGLSMDADTAQSAADLGDSLGRLRSALKSISMNVIAAFAPAIQEAAEWLSRVTGGVAKWVQHNRSLILLVIKVAAAVGAFGGALVALGGALAIASMALGGLVTLWTTLGTVLAAVVSPVGLIVAALAGLTYAFFRWTDMGRSALAWLTSAFQTFAGEATSSWRAIVNSIKAGDLQSAFGVAMAFLRVQWLRVTAFLVDHWRGFRDGFLDIWDEAMGFFSKLFIDAGPAIEIAWVNTLNFLANAWTKFTAGFMSRWRSTQNWFAKGFARVIAKATGQDVNEVLQTLEEDYQRQQQSANAAAAARIDQNNLSREQRLQQIRDGMDPASRAAFDEVDNMTAGKQGARASARDAARQRDQAALAKAQEELTAAITEANQLTASSLSTLQTPETTAEFEAGAERAANAATANDIRTAEGLRSIMSAFGGRSAEQQIAHSSAETASNTGDIAADVEEIGDFMRRELGGDALAMGDA